MCPLPETYDYVELGAGAPDPDPDTCPTCNRECCPTWCTPTYPSPYRSRYVPRVENGDPES